MLLFAACPPRAQAGWTHPSVLLRGERPVLLDTVVRPDGSLLKAVVHGDVALGLLDGSERVVLRPPASVAQVALAPDGGGVTLLTQRHAPSSVVAFDAQGAVQPPVTLNDAGAATVAISPGGAAVAAWVAKTAAGYEVDAAFRDPGSPAFGAPVRAGYATDADQLVHAGIADRGEAVVTWQENFFPSKLAAAVRLPGAGFSPARFLSDDAIDAQLAVGPGGQAIIAVPQEHATAVSIKPPGADALPAAQRLERAPVGFATAVAAAGDRRVALASLAAAGRHGKARARVYEGATRLRRVGTVGKDGGGEFLGLAIDGAGATVVSWEEELKAKRGDPSARAHLGAAYRPAGGRFGAPRLFGPVSLDSTPLATQIAPAGRAYVLYEAFKTNDSAGAGFDRIYLAERTP